MRTVYGNHQRFETTYFKKFPGYYVTGDGEAPIWRCQVYTPVLYLWGGGAIYDMRPQNDF